MHEEKDSVRILVVDDDPAFLLSTHILHSFAAEVVYVRSVEEARQELNLRQFDVVLVDTDLAGDGSALGSELTVGNMPVIFLADRAEQRLSSSVHRNPSVSLLYKPFLPAELQALIRTVLPLPQDDRLLDDRRFLEHLVRSVRQLKRTKQKAAIFALHVEGLRQTGRQRQDSIELVRKNIARRLHESAGEGAIVGSHGDDFLILIDDITDYETSLRVADQMLLSAGAGMRSGRRRAARQANRISMGISLYPLDGDSAEQLIELAGVAMALAGSGYRYYNASVEKVAVSWRRYRSKMAARCSGSEPLFQIIRTTDSNQIYSIQPDFFPFDPGMNGALSSVEESGAASWSEACWRLLVFLHQEADASWRSVLPAMRIQVRTPIAALVEGEVLYELIHALKRRHAHVILEMTELDLQSLLVEHAAVLRKLERENVVFAVREWADLIESFDQMRLPIDSYILPTVDMGQGMLHRARTEAHVAGRRVLFDHVSEADVLQRVRGAGQDLYRGALAGDLLSAADVLELMKK